MTTGCGNYDSPTYIKAARRRTDDQMRAFLKRVDFDGVSVDTSAVAGYCPAAIYEAAAKQGANLIIISTHGRTGLRRMLIGSVAEATVRSAACPVLVVPSLFEHVQQRIQRRQVPGNLRTCARTSATRSVSARGKKA